jgi:hypothetical protein
VAICLNLRPECRTHGPRPRCTALLSSPRRLRTQQGFVWELIVEFTDDAVRDFVPDLPYRYVSGFYDNLRSKHSASFRTAHF